MTIQGGLEGDPPARLDVQARREGDVLVGPKQRQLCHQDRPGRRLLVSVFSGGQRKALQDLC